MTPKTDSVAVLRERVLNYQAAYAEDAADSKRTEGERAFASAVASLLTDTAAALSAQGEPATYGIRRKGETAIIGIVPEKIHRLPPTSGEYARDYEEVPLYLHPAPPGSDAVTELRKVAKRNLRSLIERSADPEKALMLKCLEELS